MTEEKRIPLNEQRREQAKSRIVEYLDMSPERLEAIVNTAITTAQEVVSKKSLPITNGQVTAAVDNVLTYSWAKIELERPHSLIERAGFSATEKLYRFIIEPKSSGYADEALREKDHM